jgi:ribonuclease HI
MRLIKYLDALLSTRGWSGQQVRFEHVRGHMGEVGNEGADALAVHGAQLPEVEEPDWDALGLGLGRVPVHGTLASVESIDASVSHV